MANSLVMLAHNYSAKKHNVAGWYISEKLDGMRAFWDGGVSRGVLKSQVPWANTTKDERYIDEPIATGLWSRYGNVVHAPGWWLNTLPPIPLDGELFAGRNNRQYLMSTVKDIAPNDIAWEGVNYHIFDIPPFPVIFGSRIINIPNCYIHIDRGACGKFVAEHNGTKIWDIVPENFKAALDLLKRNIQPKHEIVYVVDQVICGSYDHAFSILSNVSDIGGEGIILRNPLSWWMPERSHNMLKMKRVEDAEGIVTGYVTGSRTDRGSKLLGMMGALIINYKGKQLRLSGFTDADRMLQATERKNASYLKADAYDKTVSKHAQEWATEHPEEECPDWIEAKSFPRGTKVTFKYRGFSKDGIPQEARYHRICEEL